MGDNNFFKMVTTSMEKFKLLKIEDNIYKFSPAIYLIGGKYPDDEKEDNTSFEQLSLGMEE